MSQAISITTIHAAAKPPKSKSKAKNPPSTIGFGNIKRKEDPPWKCVQNCGACCKLVKSPSFATPEEIFENPSDIELYKTMVGPDGWCIHLNKSTRTCSIYNERPYFCRVEPSVFETLYGIDKKKFNKEACSCCRDSIKAVYGARSQELENFNRNLKCSSAS
ncbi:hypothetical protein IFM89_000138 [Coptis chinensis]|uniref:Uncharacterized protein n=1 Tax=Coptis chinensis TaxID=261450 RepID=A0A835H344_9MAGN|nr:hypothetical protein IFM89_000138 [Coptis chinensis]